jgi:hypothetical protein
MTRRGWSVYTVGETVRWVVDDDRVIVVVIGAVPAAHVLQGREALIWSVLTSSRDLRKLAEFLEMAADLTEPAAEQELRAVLGRWTQLGIVSHSTGGPDG